MYLATTATQLSNTRNQSEPGCSTRHWHQISHESRLCVGEGSSPLHRQFEQPMWHSSIWRANPAPFPLLLLLQLPPKAVHRYCNSHVRSLCTCIRRGWHWWWSGGGGRYERKSRRVWCCSLVSLMMSCSRHWEARRVWVSLLRPRDTAVFLSAYFRTRSYLMCMETADCTL